MIRDLLPLEVVCCSADRYKRKAVWCGVKRIMAAPVSLGAP
jgi:hypothetical protein